MPNHNQVISFDRAPRGSFAQPGARYRVDTAWDRFLTRLIDVQSGRTIYESPRALARAAFTVIA